MYKCNAVGDNFVKNSVLTMTTYVLWHKMFAPTSQSGVLLFKQLNMDKVRFLNASTPIISRAIGP